MRNLAIALLLGSVLLAGAIAAPTLYAEIKSHPAQQRRTG